MYQALRLAQMRACDSAMPPPWTRLSKELSVSQRLSPISRTPKCPLRAPSSPTSTAQTSLSLKQGKFAVCLILGTRYYLCHPTACLRLTTSSMKVSKWASQCITGLDNLCETQFCDGLQRTKSTYLTFFQSLNPTGWKPNHTAQFNIDSYSSAICIDKSSYD